MMDNEAGMVILLVSHKIWVIYVTEVWPNINMSKSKAATSDFHGSRSSKGAIDKNLI